MKTTLLSLILFSFLIFNSTADAQSHKRGYTNKGTWEFGGEIFFTSTTNYFSSSGLGNESSQNSTLDDFMINAEAGYFVIKGLKLGIEPGVEVTGKFFDHTHTMLKLYFTPEYVFDTKTILYPYIAGSVGFTSMNPYYYYLQSASGFSWGVKGGLKINLAGNSLLNIGLRYFEEQYNTTFTDPYINTYDFKNKYKLFGLTLGWSVFF